MTNRVRLLALVWVFSALTASCRNQAPVNASPSDRQSAAVQKADNGQGEDNDKANDAKEYYYSPFVVRLGGGHFDTVSFKDVGLDRESKDAHHPLLEVISQSFAYQIAQHDELGYKAEVVYDEEILDPANHLYCGFNHLYVDVWQSSSPDRWGYSLWAGCSELDNFAWKEVADTAGEQDLIRHVEPLTSSIVNSLAEAAQSKCFQKTC